jgi:uncharacterized membrane protein
MLIFFLKLHIFLKTFDEYIGKFSAVHNWHLVADPLFEVFFSIHVNSMRQKREKKGRVIK